MPLVLITGHLLENTRIALFKEILLKPFALGDLLASVERILPDRNATMNV
jgi:hypothetical protein